MTDRLSILKTAMAAQGLDALVVFSDINRNYLSRFTGTSGAVLILGKQAYFLTDSRYTVQARRQVRGAKLLHQTRALLAELAGHLKAAKARRIGFEAGHLTVAQHDWLKRQVPGAVWLPSQAKVEAQRLRKDPEERAVMRRAARITDQALAQLLPQIRPGRREDQLAAELEYRMRLLGAEKASFDTILASGWRSALPHGVASAKKVQAGDMIVIDFGCVVDGYCSDMTRTVVVGKPSALQKKVYGIVQRSQSAGLKAIRPGRSAGAVDLACRRLIEKAGYGRHFGHSTGHGVGREVHEAPTVGPRSKDLLKPGMAITVEPGIYLPGKFGVRIEDLAFVTPTGHENLYSTTKALISV